MKTLHERASTQTHSHFASDIDPVKAYGKANNDQIRRHRYCKTTDACVDTEAANICKGRGLQPTCPHTSVSSSIIPCTLHQPESILERQVITPGSQVTPLRDTALHSEQQSRIAAIGAKQT
jgi:hypothetical protein